MASLRRQAVFLLLLFQLVAVRSSWIVESISRRHYRPQYNSVLPNPRPSTYAVRTPSPKTSYVKYGLSKKRISADNQVVEVKPTRTGQRTSTTKCPSIDIFPLNFGIPCHLARNDTPMFVYFSFDDAVTSSNIVYYRRLFADRRNPNGCPIRATFFNSDSSTQYDLVSELYSEGHEIASHSISHRGPSTWWSQTATKDDWYKEIVGQRDNIHRQTAALGGRKDGGVPVEEIRGMRAPFLAIGGDDQFQVLEENRFVYDSSIPNNNARPLWPFTMNDPSLMNGPICRSRHCPMMPHRVWEAVMNVYFLNESGSVTPCSMVDGCRPRDGHQGALAFLQANFLRHYGDENKVPFGINMHAAWFAFDGYFDAMNEFIDEIMKHDDVYIVPIYKLIQWIKQPTPLSQLKHSKFGCQNQ